MEINTKICLLVCAFAAAREFRPLEPFFTEFLVGPDIGFTEKQAVQDIFVIWSYSSFVLIIVVFLITDFLRYKPIIVADGVAGILTYLLLLGHPSLRTIQIEQLFYSFFYSSDTAYYTYMYAKIQDKTSYNIITGYARAAVLFGKFLSGCVSQIFVSFGGSSKLSLVYLSIGGMTVTTIVGLLFPPVEHSLYFHRKEDEQAKSQAVGMDPPPSSVPVSVSVSGTQVTVRPNSVKKDQILMIHDDRQNLSTVVRHLMADFKSSFTNQKVIVWAFWWSFAGAGSNLVLSYCQVIWKQVIDENYDHMTSWNGIVECIYTSLSAVASYKVGTLNCDWSKHCNLFLMVGSLCIGILVTLTSQLKNLPLLYLCHILFGLTYHTMLTVAEFEIAKQIKGTCYGLVFGFIAFVTIMFTALWTLIVVEDTFFTFNIQRQFEFCAVYFLAIGTYYLLKTIQQLLWGNEST